MHLELMRRRLRRKIPPPAPPVEISAAPPEAAATSEFDLARSEENILAWMEYLPQDCIETMIRMGWDLST